MLYDENCRYCAHTPDLDALTVKVCDMEVSTLYLFREQTYRGRCLLAYGEHAREIYDLSEESFAAFSRDIRNASAAIAKATHFDKLNLAVCGDKQPHLHIHIIPKYEDGAEWGQVFVMNPKKTYLCDEEYAALAKEICDNLNQGWKPDEI